MIVGVAIGLLLGAPAHSCEEMDIGGALLIGRVGKKMLQCCASAQLVNQIVPKG